jgi:hypothetical protein
LVPFIRDELGRICDRFTQETSIVVTPTTRDLAAEIISAILEDPHPTWKVEAPQTFEYTQRYLSDSTKLLHAIRAEQNIKERITAFDLLHWLTRGEGLESWLCLIPK